MRKADAKATARTVPVTPLRTKIQFGIQFRTEGIRSRRTRTAAGSLEADDA
jgi:hypothetical protein